TSDRSTACSQEKMEADKFLEKFYKPPGFDLVIAVITGLVVPLVFARVVMEDWGLVIIPVVWAGALVLSGLSGYFDSLLFDPLYGASKGQADNKDKPRAGKVIWARCCDGLRRMLFLVT